MSTGRTLQEEKAWVHAALQRHVDSGGLLSVGEPVVFGTSSNEFYSSLFTADARGPAGDVPLIMKILPEGPRTSYSDMRFQFRNECLVYERFLPLAFKSAPGEPIEELFPKFHHAYEDSSQCLLVLENVTPLGFKLAPKLLDLKHVRLAVQELGRFHALSYIAKRRHPEEFSQLAKRLYPWDEESCRELTPVIVEMVRHAIDSFQVEYPTEGEKNVHQLAKLDAAASKLVKLTEPEEPLAVICHGDYNRNNVLYKYDEDGNPASMKIIDFQLTTYSSPAIDIALVLFMSTLPEVLGPNWDDLFDTYHSSLLDTMEQGLHCQRGDLENQFSKEELMKDFKIFCLHAFIITAFYMPVTVLSPEEFSALGEEISPDSREFFKHLKRFTNPETNRRLANLIKILIERDII